MPSIADNYYLKGTTNGEDGVEPLARIEGLATSDDRFENDWLDFKGGQDANRYSSAPAKDKGKIKDQLIQSWSEIIGAFANSEGGTVIWGVDAHEKETPNGTKTDKVTSLSPIANLDAFRSLLKTAQGFATDPPLAGILHQPVERPDRTGYLVSLIPEGTQKPYRSERSGKRFLQRNGDHKTEISVAALRSLFFPQFVPRVVVTTLKRDAEWLPYFQLMNQHASAFLLQIEIYNIGVVSLVNPFFQVTPFGGMAFNVDDSHFDEKGLPRLSRHVEAERLPAQVIHPRVKSKFMLLVTGPKESPAMALFVMSENNCALRTFIRLDEVGGFTETKALPVDGWGEEPL